MTAGVEGAGVSLAEEDQTEDAPAGVSLGEADQTDDEAQTEDDAPAGVSLGEADTTDEPTGKTLLGLGPAGRDGELAAAGLVSVTGHTVVETAIVEVVTIVESAGQLVTLAAQLVMVISLVA